MPPDCHSLASLPFSQWENLYFLVAPKHTANCATARGSMCLHPTPGQQHKAAHGQAQPGLQESLAAALKGRWSHPPSVLEHEIPGLLISTHTYGLLCPRLCVAFTASVSPSTVSPVVYLQSTGAET